MDDNVISQLREVIKAEYQVKIDKLREEMEAELIALSRLAPRLKSLSPLEANEMPQESVKARVKSTRTKFPELPSIKDRLRGALNRMQGTFTSAELFDNAIHDATGVDISKPTFHSILSRMIKDGEIAIVKKQFGFTPGTYKKPEALTESTSEAELS